MLNCMQCNLKITNWLNQKWYSKNIFSILLLPFSWIYSVIIFIRRQLYCLNILKSCSFEVPIIVIGNITVGGTGKTPLVIALANFFKKNHYKPGIVSRGYGRTSRHPAFIPGAGISPAQLGDEPILIAQKTHCPVVVDHNRCRAVETLLKQYNCDIVISDDGLQHYALNRDIEIAVIDGQRRLGNNYCLPAGPLRESKKRLSAVDFIAVTGEIEQGEYPIHIMTQSIYNLVNPEQILDVKTLQEPVHAVAGIGNPQKFFKSLRQLGITYIPHIYPDHYLYQQSDFNFLDDSIVIMTEKDAVKCQEFADHRYWCLPIEAMATELQNAVLEKLQKRHMSEKGI